MTDIRLRNRHRLRQKEIRALADRLEQALGGKVFDETTTVDMAEGPGYDVVYVEGKILAIVYEDGTPFLTVRGLLRYAATKRFVTVDMGAVRFVANGADVMGPGIVDADAGIAEGDLVWIRDVKNKRPLAVGKALMSGECLAKREKGRSIASVHHVGDRIWQLDELEEEEEEH
jgi:PUA domain protein